MTEPPRDPPPVAELPVTAKFARVSVGDVLDDRFEITEPISTGGTAAVYACRDRALRCRAAVKILTEPSEDARRRFLDEGRLLANLRSPHLVQVLAVGDVDRHTPYIALELLPGRSLQDRLQMGGPLPWRQVVDLLGQVAGALAFLHSFGVIHRDIKPGNIVQVGSTTGRPLVKLIDLGIAKVRDWDLVELSGFTPSPRHQTEAKLVVGTPGFYPPEANYAPEAGHVKVVGPAYDVYGLGATLYMLCTGRMPKHRVASSNAAIVELSPMNELNPKCAAPPELEALVRSALAVLPEDRIATAEEFQRRLETIRAAHADESVPHLFAGCFELIEPLGVGAKGEVYKAYCRDAPCYVALKLLSERSKADPDERAYFAREARVLRAVKHPALPKLIECRTSEKQRQPYIAMTLAPGKPAGEFCFHKKSLQPADVIAVGKCIAGALAALHAHGILHRDVHAPNVLIDLEHQPTSAMLIDVGMAELTEKFYAVVDQRYPTRVEDQVKLSNLRLERLDWTAPEARDGGGWTGKSDVYSLALLLYRLLTGKRPITPAGALISPREFRPKCPQALASALLTALHPDPAHRVDAVAFLAMLDAAADELAEESDEASVDAPAPARPATRIEGPPAPPNRPSRAWPRVLMGAMAVLVLGLVVRASAPTIAVSPEPVAASGVVAPDRLSGPDVVPEPPRSDVLVDQPPVPEPSSVPAQGSARASLPTMQEALAAADRNLRACSQLTGGLLMVAYSTEPARDQFAKVAVRGYEDPAVDRCVQNATTALRFEPQERMLFTKEYTP